MGSYGLQSVPTGACVQFIDEVPNAEDLQVLVESLVEKRIKVVYIDCEVFLQAPWRIPDEVGRQAGTEFPPYSEEREVNWVRFWDDLVSLGHRAEVGLVIVLDNARPLWEQNRKFITTFVENFLHGLRPWVKRDVPYHLCIQLEPSELVAKLLKPLAASSEA
ncbi:hypothetical protein HZ992_14660 [Rhizobacter sp. AJA081-3]|uniref:hypothetical protein n=1 Tax=Rhizobacter sp. AJA081-3 TaxID=2753607 RepID=UPI001AE07B8C|nr:hypothetical protein [Rhizobacter sp. AJA081-3]QTN21426.1 hypothetical protein HZ992_14660 [Rhizobacter sp. AJA081-3]